MNIKRTLIMLLLFVLLIGKAISQNALPDTSVATPTNNVSSQLSTDTPQKGSFFIAPFYQYAKYSNLKLVSHTNHFTDQEGESTEEFGDEQLVDYNNEFETEYLSSMTALRIGYKLFNEFGVSAYVGASHFNFKSWATENSEQNHTTQSPALTVGLAFDYEKAVYKKITIVSMLSAHYVGTKTAAVDNNSGEEVVSSSFKALNWQFDLGIAYPFGKFTPYAGVGFTQQYVNSIQVEQILTTDNNGADFYATMEFDAHYSESSFYGFAGLEYQVRKNLSIYGNSSFTNPLRANIGIKIKL